MYPTATNEIATAIIVVGLPISAPILDIYSNKAYIYINSPSFVLPSVNYYFNSSII